MGRLEAGTGRNGHSQNNQITLVMGVRKSVQADRSHHAHHIKGMVLPKDTKFSQLNSRPYLPFFSLPSSVEYKKIRESPYNFIGSTSART